MSPNPQSLYPHSLAGAVIAFDLDGTLVDTAPDLVGALNAVLEQEGLPALPLNLARTMVGRGARTLITQGFAAAGRPLHDEQRMDALLERFIAIYRGRIALESRAFPGVEAALDALSDAGAVLCVCTNKLTSLSLELLDALDLRESGSPPWSARTPRPRPSPIRAIC